METALRLFTRKPPQRHYLRRRYLKLAYRVWQHKNDLVEGFTRLYGVHTLVWYEAHDTMEATAAQEKEIKDWKWEWEESADLEDKSRLARPI